MASQAQAPSSSRGGVLRTVPTETLEFLDANGYCTVPALLDSETCELVRSMMDEFLGPPCAHIDFQARGMQKGSMWPERSAVEGGGPLLTEEGPYMHSLQHPIPDARTALPVPPLLEVMGDVLRSDPSDLVLIHQNFRRTDPSPGPHPEIRPDGTFDGAKAAFHQDSGFLLSHYDTSPRQTYYICILAFTPVVSGGAAFVYAPGSMAAARAGAAAVPTELAESVTAAGCRTILPRLIQAGPHGKALEATKTVAQEAGDLLILDPFCTHAASKFRQEVADATGLAGRYVLFSLVASRASVGTTLAGIRSRNYVAPATKYTDELRNALPAQWRHVLDWTLPEEADGGLKDMSLLEHLDSHHSLAKL